MVSSGKCFICILVKSKHQKTAAAAAEELAQRQKFEKKWQKNKFFNKKFDEFTAETSVTAELFRSLNIYK